MSEMGVRNLNGLNKLIQEAKNNDRKILIQLLMMRLN